MAVQEGARLRRVKLSANSATETVTIIEKTATMKSMSVSSD